MTLALLPLDASTYRTHPVHTTERIWTETNCYVDVWIELLHALDLDPIAAAAFCLSTDFEGDQWTFFKYPPEDLRAVYGIEVSEMNVWRRVIDHVIEQLELGRLLTVEVDSWFLPDTRGVSYQLAHVKSTIVPQSVDVAGRRLEYFHNAGYFALEGDDFDGVFGLGAYHRPDALPPYVEAVRLDRMRRASGTELVDLALDRVSDHLSRRPTTNPLTRFEARLNEDVSWLLDGGIEMFHQYAFGTCRQCGASMEMAGTFVDWLTERHEPARQALGGVGAAFRQIAEGCKALEFSMARMARGRKVDLAEVFAPLASAWESAMSADWESASSRPVAARGG